MTRETKRKALNTVDSALIGGVVVGGPIIVDMISAGDIHWPTLIGIVMTTVGSLINKFWARY